MVGEVSHSSVVMPDGSIVLMGGNDYGLKNDVWRSTDNGATWTEVNASAGWSARDTSQQRGDAGWQHRADGWCVNGGQSIRMTCGGQRITAQRGLR